MYNQNCNSFQTLNDFGFNSNQAEFQAEIFSNNFHQSHQTVVPQYENCHSMINENLSEARRLLAQMAKQSAENQNNCNTGFNQIFENQNDFHNTSKCQMLVIEYEKCVANKLNFWRCWFWKINNG